MQISEIHALALELLNSDTSDYEPTKLMSYTNPGILYINNIRVAAKDPETIKQVIITTPIIKPTDFLGYSPPTAAFPLVINNGMIERSPGAPPSVVLKYTIKPARVSKQADIFPLPDEYADMVASYIQLRLKRGNDDEISLKEDFDILDRETSALAKAKGG